MKFEDAQVGWGFKVKQMSAEEKQKSLKNPNDPNNLKVKLEEMKKPIITGLNLDLKSGDFLTVVG